MPAVMESVLAFTVMVVLSGAEWVWEHMAGVTLTLFLSYIGWDSLVYRAIALVHNNVASDLVNLAATYEEMSRKHEALALAVRTLSARLDEMSDRDEEIGPEE